MYKRLKVFTLLISTLAIIIIFIGTTLINNQSWGKIKEDFHNSKVKQINFYISKSREDVTALIHANAPWTELQDKMAERNIPWLEDSATGYLVENESFKIDFVMATSEDLSFINQYGDDVKAPIMATKSFDLALHENTMSSEILWINETPMLIVAAPITNNEFGNPLGVYVLGRWINDENLEDLRSILGEDIIKSLTFTHERTYSQLITKNYSSIKFSTPVQLYKTLDYINLEFNTPLYKDAFYVQKVRVLSIIFITGLAFLALWFVYLRRFSKGISEVVEAVKMISQGDYDTRVKQSDIEEIQQLALSVNKMALDITDHIHEIDKSYLAMIEIMANSVEINDIYTSHHNMRVANFARSIGEVLCFEDIETLHIAARLHDIGKLAISNEIINKPGKLTPEEFEIIKEHPIAGFQIMDKIDFFKTIKYGVLYHHERYDGTGYPHGLKGDEIPMIAQIISVADVFDALASDRPYRVAFGYIESLDIIKENSSKMFNPIIVDAFVGIMEHLYDLSNKKEP